MELINKYRPKLFKHVIGQDKVCRSIRAALKSERSRSFLLSGPPGMGKTTIARLIAKTVGCPPQDTIEIDGATNTGIDAMREVTQNFAYKSLTGNPRVIIIDECHAISPQAWKSLLKSIEEPPQGVYWVLCTTELTKVPKAVITRCVSHHLDPVARESLFQFAMKVAEDEGLPIGDSTESIDAISELAGGSPRQVLADLAAAGHLTDEEEVREICSETGGDAGQEAVDLCRLLMKPSTPWKDLMACIKSIKSPPESVRIVVLNYMASVILNGKKPDSQLAIMEEFAEPFQDREGKAPLILACARLTL